MEYTSEVVFNSIYIIILCNSFRPSQILCFHGKDSYLLRKRILHHYQYNNNILILCEDTPFEYGYLNVVGSGAFYNAEFFTNPGLDFVTCFIVR